MTRRNGRPLRPFCALTGALWVLGCDGGCERGPVNGAAGGGVAVTASPPPPGAHPTNVIDCPDGLARCSDGIVAASRLWALALPCKGPETTCACPWEEIAICGTGCVAEGLEIVIDRAEARTQLCKPAAGLNLLLPHAPHAEPVSCDETQLYRCIGDAVVDCSVQRVVAQCVRGCFREGAFIDGDAPVEREAAFAILCSR